MTTAVLLLVLLVGPVSGLVGVAAGSFMTYRLMRGQSPLPSLPRRAKIIDESPPANDKPRVHPPRVRA